MCEEHKNGARALGALKLSSEARDENVPAKRADFFCYVYHFYFLAQKRKVITEKTYSFNAGQTYVF